MKTPDSDGTTYHCVAGHDIPRARLNELTSVEMLDARAEVRVCVEHGAPISETHAARPMPIPPPTNRDT